MKYKKSPLITQKLIYTVLVALSINVSANTDMPDYYSAPGLNMDRDFINEHANEYIDPFTGKLQLHHTDLVIPLNGGMDIKIQRSYTSLDDKLAGEKSVVGQGWTMHFGRVIMRHDGVNWPTCKNVDLQSNEDNPVLELPDGSREVLLDPYYSEETVSVMGVSLPGIPSSGDSTSGSINLGDDITTDDSLTDDSTSNDANNEVNVNGEPDYITKNRWVGYCDQSDNILLIKSPDGMQYEMTKKVHNSGELYYWYTKRIIDRNGNAIVFEYLGDDDVYSAYNKYALLDNIYENNTKNSPIVSFNYENVDNDDVVLESITSGSRTWRYIFAPTSENNKFYLKKVKLPDKRYWSYNYKTTAGDGIYSIKQVEHPYGGVTNYTYERVYFSSNVHGLSTVLTKKTSNAFDGKGVSTWTYDYYPSMYTDELDWTKVVSPNSETRYYHYGYGAISSSKSSVQGKLWLMGALRKKITCELNVSGGCRDATSLSKELYDWYGQKISEEKDYGPRSLTEIDTYARLLGIQSFERNGVSYTTENTVFNKYGQPTKVVFTSNNNKTRKKQYVYTHKPSKWILGLKKSETLEDEDGKKSIISRTFDGAGNVKTETINSVTTKYYYNGDGTVDYMLDPRGIKTDYNEYVRNIAKEEIHPENTDIVLGEIHQEEVVYEKEVNSQGTIKSLTDGRGNKTSYTYDKMNRLEFIDLPKSTSQDIAITWESNGGTGLVSSSTGLVRTIDRYPYRHISIYDGFGREISTTKMDRAKSINITQTSEYDALGNKTFTSYPNSTSGVHVTYDALNRKRTETYPGDDTVEYIYTGATGNHMEVVNELGITTKYHYEAFGNPDEKELVKIEAPEDIVTEITRNVLGQVTKITQGDLTRTFEYDDRYYLKRKYDPEIGYTLFDVDDSGNVTGRSTGRDLTETQTAHAAKPMVSYQYDDFNQVYHIAYRSGSNDLWIDYDKDQNFRYSTDGDFVRTESYDENSQLIQETLKVDGTSFVTTYTRDLLDTVDSITYPSGMVVSYLPDALGRSTAVSPYITEVEHYPSGMLRTLEYSNGYTTTFTQTNRLWLNVIQTTGTDTIVNLDYGYDDAGNIKSIANSVDSSLSKTMSYDDTNRLTDISGPWGTMNIGYDEVGNIEHQNSTDQEIEYVYDSTYNRLESISGAVARSYGYDALGNVTSDGTQTYNYNLAGNLTTITGTELINFSYDDRDLRYLRSKNGLKRYFIHSKAGNELFEMVPGESKYVENVYLNSQRIASIESVSDSGDMDNDGLPDDYEHQYGLNLLVDDADLDTDEDGLTNAEEYTYGTNPNTNDSDSDLLLDNEEIAYGTDPMKSDTDGDGVSDYDEVQAGTDPNFNLAAFLAALHIILF